MKDNNAENVVLNEKENQPIEELFAEIQSQNRVLKKLEDRMTGDMHEKFSSENEKPEKEF